MPARCSSISSRESSERSCAFPLGSPIIPVPPPTMAIGECPARCSRASAITGSNDPTCRLDAVGSKPMYAVTRSVAKSSRRPSVLSYTMPRHCSSSKRFMNFPLLYQSMAVTRRAVLKTLAAASVGAVAGTGAHGFVYGRHALEVTRAKVVVAGWPPALAGLRLGLLTDVHRSRFVSHEDVAHAVAALMLERPDLIVLGGDYVTYGDRRFVGTSADALAPLSAQHGIF